MDRRKEQAFTLIELMIGIAVTLIVLSISVPAMASFVAGNAQSAAVNQFMGELNLARQSAVRLQQPVTVCPSQSGLSCESWASWSDGLIIFVDPNRDNILDADETLLRRINTSSEVLSITPKSRFRWSVRFQPDGSAGGKNGTHVLCAERSLSKPKAVVISNAGRIRVRDANPNECV